MAYRMFLLKLLSFLFWICHHFMLHNYSMLYQVKTDGKVIVLPAQEQNCKDSGCNYIYNDVDTNCS